MEIDASTQYDFSNYNTSHPLYDEVNKKVIGFMKDELGGLPMRECVGLRPKCYSFLFDEPVAAEIEEDREEVVMVRRQKATAKAVKQSIKKKHLLHHIYLSNLQALSNSENKNKTVKVVQNTIVSRDHVLKSVQQTRIALSATDDKRWIKNDGINTLPYGHYKTLI